MIRPFTCICMLMAAGSGLYLYQTKHRAQLLDREIARTYKQIDQTKDRIGVLKGDWALLNEPERLNELAQQHLSLKTLAPTQFAALAELGARLPAPMPKGAVMAPFDEPAPVAAASVSSAPVAVTVAVKPMPALTSRTFAAAERSAAMDKPALEKVAALVIPPPPATPPRTAPRAASAPAAPVPAALAPAVLTVLPPRTAPQHFYAPVMNVSAGTIQQNASRAQSPGSVGESVMRAREPAGHTTRPASVTASPAVPAAYSSQASYTAQLSSPSPGPATYATAYGSALGGAAHVALPAPVPYGSAQAGR